LIRAELLVRGAVQKVGYRDYVQETARGLGVKGFVESLRDDSVRIVCEADERVLEEFIDLVDVERELIAVESVEVVERGPAVGEFDYFDIKYGPLEEELGERLVAAYKIAVATREEVKSRREDIKAMHTDLKGEVGGVREDIKAMHTDLKGEVGGVREDIKAMHTDLKGEIGGLGEDIRAMHVDMNRSFEEMARRYDAISAELVRTREELTRAVDGLLRVIEEFIRGRHGDRDE
jgi:acylphosphatase